MMPDAMRTTLRRTYAEHIQKTCESKWREACTFFRRRPDAAQGLKAIEKARREGRMTDEQAERRIEEILGAGPAAPR
jgi:hypothetical protein